MHGRNKRSAGHRSLAFLVLGGLGLTAFAVPAIASNQVNVNVSPTTGYYEVNPRTYRAPSNARVGGLPSAPVVSPIPSGGLGQSISSGIEITALKDGRTYSSTINATVRAGTSALKNGAVRCLTSFRCTTAAGLAAVGLQALLDNVNWQLSDDGTPVEVTENQSLAPSSGTGGWHMSGTPFRLFESPEGACQDAVERDPARMPSHAARRANGIWYCTYNDSGVGWDDMYFKRGTFSCPGGSMVDNICMGDRTFTPVPPSVVSDTVHNQYNPHPSDWPWLTGGLDLSAPDVDIEIVDIPSITGAGSPDFIEWHDGTSQGTYSELDFSVSGNPGKQPSISARETTTSTDYDAQGNPTGTTTSISESTSSLFPPVEPPTDCEFMPTVCRFIEWFTEPDPSPDPDQEIRDLVQVYEDGGRDVVVGSDTGSCPPPRTIQLSLVPPVEFSFQPFCDLATAVRFWFLAIASFGAAYMTVRSI